MSIRKIGFTILLVLSLPGVGHSAGPYVELGVGPSFLADSDLSGSASGTPLSGTASFDPGFNISGALGYRISRFFRTELNLNYRLADVDEVKSGSTTLAGAGEASVFAAMVNAYLDVDTDLPVTPFAGFGIGVGLVEVESNSSANVLIVNDDSTEFAWNVMAGLSFPVYSNLSASAAYRYFSTTDAELDATVTGVGSGKMEAEAGAHEIVFAVRYEF